MDNLLKGLASPEGISAIVGLCLALSAWLRASTARQEARHALNRLGGPRKTPAKTATPPPATGERRT